MNHHFNRIIEHLTSQFARMEAQALRESEFADLSMKQVVYLETIARMENPTFTDLARELKVSKPSVTAIFNKLHEKGYLSREQSTEDRRTYSIHLTEKGKSLRQAHDNLHHRIAAHFAGKLDQDEQSALSRLLAKIAGLE